MSDTETHDDADVSDADAAGDATDPPSEAPTHDAGSGGAADEEAGEAPKLTRRGRVRKWDRTPPPKDWRWYVGNVGKGLIAVGILMFAFVGYQLYGTGIETAAAQNRLEDEFEAQLARFDAPAPPAESAADAPNAAVDAPAVTVSEVTVPADEVEESVDESAEDGARAEPAQEPADDDAEPVGDTSAEPAREVVPVAEQNVPEVDDGDALARLEIPAIDVNDIVVAGVDKSDLKQGPGHFPDTPLPGQLGNTAIAGHRTTFGQPFRNVDRLAVGDEIRITTPNGVFVYLVTGQQIVSPEQYQVIATSDPTVASITLVSCHPVFTARERIIIFGELDPAQSSTVGEPILNYGREEEPEPLDELPVDESPVGDIAVADSAVPTTSGVDGGEGDPVPADSDDPAPTTAEASSAAEPDSDTAAAPNASDQLGSDAVNAGIADAFSEGWFSDPAANSQVGVWGVALAAIAAAAYAISRRFRRDLVGLAVGLLPFAVALYFFFQNVNRLLPPNL